MQARLEQGGRPRARAPVKPGAVAALLVLSCLGCGSKAAVTVSATIEQPMLSVSQAPGGLAAALSGSYVLHLELGQVAPGGTDATVQASSLQTKDQSLLLPLKTLADPAGSIHLEPGQQADVRFTVAERTGVNAQMITTQQAMQICGVGMAAIVGAISDTASGTPTPVTSATFAISGTGCSP
jgi:hypothetical protein